MAFSSLGIYDVFSLLIAFIVIYTTQFYYRYFTRPNPLPGPFPLPILGNAHQKGRLDFKDWYMILHKKYGDIFEIHLGQRSIILCNIDLIEKMLITSTKTKYPYRLHLTEGLMEYFDCGINGMGLINNNDLSSWKYNRQFFTQAMLAPCLNNQAIEWTNELWEEMESYWNKLGENQELDLTSWMRRFMSEIVYKISTGVKSGFVLSYYSTFVPENSLSDKEKEKIKEYENFTESFDTYLDGALYFLTFNKFIRDHFPFVRDKVNNLLKLRDYCFGKMYNAIRERRIEIENTPLDQPLRHDMLTSFLTANTPRDISAVKHADNVDLLVRPITDKEIFGNILDAMRAGSNAALNMICYIIYYLEHYPEVKQRFRQELETVLGKDLTRSITVKDINELQYCDAIIKEVSRLNPVFYMNSRVNSKEDEIGGFSWPEGTSFRILYTAILKCKDYWTDPEKFDPDRFYKLEEEGKYLLEKKYINKTFIMFGHGIRICPGRKLGMMKLKFLLASIYRKYDVELVDMDAPLKYSSGLFLTCKELIARVKPRKF